MLCPTAMSAAVPVEANVGSATVQANASRFSQMVNAPCQDRLSVDTYVDGSVGGNGSGKQPLILDILSQISVLDFPEPSSVQSSKSEDSTQASNDYEEDASELPESDLGVSEVIAAQDEMLRTVMMFETMNCARQGVQTLFQLQG